MKYENRAIARRKKCRAPVSLPSLSLSLSLSLSFWQREFISLPINTPLGHKRAANCSGRSPCRLPRERFALCRNYIPPRSKALRGIRALAIRCALAISRHASGEKEKKKKKEKEKKKKKRKKRIKAVDFSSGRRRI